MWKLLKYEFRRARTSLLTVLGVIAVLEMYFLISLGVDHMEHVVIAAVLMMFATYGAAVYIFVRGVASYASELKAKKRVPYLYDAQFRAENHGQQVPVHVCQRHSAGRRVRRAGCAGFVAHYDARGRLAELPAHDGHLPAGESGRSDRTDCAGDCVLPRAGAAVAADVLCDGVFRHHPQPHALPRQEVADVGCAADFHRRVLGAELFAGAAAEPGGKPRL